MIRILLCCGGGFSSSAIASRMDKEIKEKNLEEKYSIEFLPFGLGLKELDRFDVVILCPHLKVELDKALKNQPCLPEMMFLRATRCLAMNLHKQYDIQVHFRKNI